MNPDSAQNLNDPLKKFTRIMVFIAVGFVALYLFIFFQLKKTESQLTSYGNVTDSAIGNFLENLPESNTVKFEKTVEGLSIVVKGGEGSSLNSDLLDSKDSSYFLNATNIKEGTLNNSQFSAWKDLEAEGITSGGKIRNEYLPIMTTTNGTVLTVNWADIKNRPNGLDNGDDVGSTSESQVEGFITNGEIDLAAGSKINGETIASRNWVTTQNYISGVNFSQITNGTGVFLDYKPDNTACAQGQVLKYDAGLSRWICGIDSGAGAIAWGDISGSIADQTDLNSALTNKLGTTASFGGDVTGNYDSIVVTNDSHDHTGATISGLSTTDFTSPNISQWTNDANFITDDTSVPKNNLADSGSLSFTWNTSELVSQVMIEGENISLLNNNSGYITGVTHAQVANGSGVYWNYKPNDVACDHGQVLKYDAGLTRWNCADDGGGGTMTWGTITGTLGNQTDLNTALTGKINILDNFGGDVSGTYNSLSVSNDSHSHTGATISGLAVSNFTSPNISQWTNDSNFISGVDITQVANGAGKYSNYKPNDVACSNGQILKYDSANSRWICGNDDAGTGGSGGGSSVVQSVTTVQSRTQDVYTVTGSGDGTVITPLNIAMTPKKVGNKIVLEWMVNGEANYNTIFNVTRNGIVLPNSNDGANRWSGITTMSYDQDEASTPNNMIVKIVDENSLDVESTYSLLIRASNVNTVSFAFNRTISSAGGDSYEAMLSTGTATEIDPSATAGSEVTVGSMTGTSLFADSTADDDWLGLGASAGRIEFDDQATDEINFLDTNIGIGTNTPSRKLDVAGSVSISGSDTNGIYWDIPGHTGYSSITVDYNTDKMYINHYLGNTRMTIDSAGNVGIGTTSPSKTLTVNGESLFGTETNFAAGAIGAMKVASANSANFIQVLADNSRTYGLTYAFNNSSTNFEIFSDFYSGSTEPGLVFGTFSNKTNQLFLDTSGKIGMGTVSPQHKLDVNGNIGLVASGYLNFGSTDGTSGYGIRDNAGVIEYKDSTGAWTALNSMTGGGSGGGIVQSITTVQTRTQDVYSAPTSGDGVALTPLNIVFTPKKAGNKILLEWTVNADATEDMVFNVTRNGTILANSNDGTNRWSGIATVPYDANPYSTPSNITIRIIDENSLDTESTYQLLVRSSYGSAVTLNLNRTFVSTGTDGYEALLSIGTATEIDPTIVSTASTSEPYILIRDEKPTGTQGGTFNSGSWVTRDLNTEVTDTDALSTVSSNQITLAAGTYKANIRAPAMGVGGHQARLYNVTDSSTTLVGTPTHSLDGNYVENDSIIQGEFTITGTKTFEVQHRGTVSKATWGLGHCANFDEIEIYTSAEFWKVQH